MELAQKGTIIRDIENKTNYLRNELKENKKTNEGLNREIKRKSELVETKIDESRILRNERANKSKNKKLMQSKHTEAETVHRARGQIGAIRKESEEYKQETTN